MNKEFYITLPSNVSSYEYFPENTVANYYTKLAHRLELDGDWEVGLSEISFTNSWYNITTNQSVEVCSDVKTYLQLVKFPAGRYDSIKMLIECINALLIQCENDEWSDVHKAPQFFFEPETRKVSLIFGVTKLPDQKPLYVKIGSELAHMLGFRPSNEALKRIGKLGKQYIHRISKLDPGVYYRASQKDYPSRAKGNEVFDLSNGVHSLYVYTNIVHPSLVGDSNTQLIRVVPIPTNVEFGSQIAQIYNNPHYMPLLMKDFDTIEIDIKDDTGTRVPFTFGRSIITLHFRKMS